uniref:Protein kinase domain-containing protein n=1 Tax=Oryza glumipatula TaxID=40148 RepID=A0A0E0AG89_9ORYZ
MATISALRLLQAAAFAVLLVCLAPATAASVRRLPTTSCPDRCGNISIPYPFGIGADCARDEGFQLDCELDSPPRLVTSSQFEKPQELVSLSLADGEARVLLNPLSKCYREEEKNRLVALGCPNLGYVVDGSDNYVSGCMSACRRPPPPSSSLGNAVPRLPGRPASGAARASYPLPSTSTCRACSTSRTGRRRWTTSSVAARCLAERLQLKRRHAQQDELRVPELATYTSDGQGYRCNCSKGYESNPLPRRRMHRKLIRTKQKFFEQNGGVILQQQMHSGGGARGFRIFSMEELKKATNIFATGHVLGRGSHGVVYKGVLEDKTVVAIKKSKMMKEAQTKEFARETFILSQINHRNVVKLLGCCLEVEVPMLVYEFVSNDTLYHYIHGKNPQS